MEVTSALRLRRGWGSRTGRGLPAAMVWLALGLAGCGVENAPAGARDGDAALFASEVQPVLRRHCAFQGCHGREGMPLTLYAVDYLRLRDPTGDVDPDDPVLDERALSEVELSHNRRALAARTGAQDPTGEALLLRLVPLSEGGIPHGDTVVFERTDDADLATLRRFLGSVRLAP